MWLTTTLEPNCGFKNKHTDFEWVRFKNGTAQVKKRIGKQLINQYDYIHEK